MIVLLARLTVSYHTVPPFIAWHRAETEEDRMNPKDPFCNSTYTDQIHMAERELSAFIKVVT